MMYSMYIRPRHRRGAYPLAAEHTLPRGVRFLLLVGAMLFIAYLLWTLFLRLLGVSTGIERAGAFLTVEDRGTVNVVIDGKQQHAENGMMVFPAESVMTGPNAHASLQFFDGSRVRLGDGTDLSITENARGSKGRITLSLQHGNIWMLTAGERSFTGSVTWTVAAPTMSFAINPGTEVELSPTSVTVFSSENAGVEVSLTGHDSFVIGEGQQWLLPANAQVGGNVFEYRSPIDAATGRSPFIVESRALLMSTQGGHISSGARPNENAELLTITAPANGTVVSTPTVVVSGTVGAGVTRLQINGYPALLDTVKKTFSQEVAPAESQGDFEIAIQAMDDARTILAEAHRTVKRAPAAPLGAPSITIPAHAGSTYRTHAEELIVRGTAPAGTQGIMVNDYKLQLFEPTKGEWSYVASLRLKNMVPGNNTYDVYAIDSTGKKSVPARLTIVQGGDEPDGVVNAGSSSTASAKPSASASSFTNNAPLEPGSLTITLPEPGTTHTETGTGFLMIGSTSPKTATVAVNDYTLQLYRPGRTVWNYIVDAAINNLRKGKNTYVIVARNKENQILDHLTYTVEYNPAR